MSGTDERQRPIPGGIDRRTLIRTVSLASVGMAGVLVMSACGGSEQAVSKATDAVKDAIKTADIPVGGGKIFTDLNVVVTQATAGVYKAFSATCTHMGFQVGAVADGVIKCLQHGSEYDIATGAVKKSPPGVTGQKPLPEKAVTLSGDGIAVT